MFDLDDRHFETTQAEGGELTAGTVYHYRQQGEIVWATYEKGDQLFGTIVGRVDPDGTQVVLRYQHVSREGLFSARLCRTRPELLPDGRYRLVEAWERLDGEGGAGWSVTEEIG